VLSVTNPLSLTTTYTYDFRGNVLTQKVGGLTTTNVYDNAGLRTKVTYPDSTYLTYTYDDAHRLIEIDDVAGDAKKFTYDNASNLTAVNVYDPSSNLKYTHTYTYDSVNRKLTSVGAAMGETTTYLYDNQSNLITVIDPLSDTTTYTYDALNRRATMIDPLGQTTTYGYDALDDLTSVTDPRGLQTTYGFNNGLRETTTVTSPDAGVVSYTYDNGGNIHVFTDARGKAATYSYDALNRTTTISYTGGSSVSYLYDTGTNGIGHITQMTDPAGTTSWTYDQYGNVLSRKQTTGSLSLTTTYTYDADKRLSTIKYPSTKTLTYAYDTSGRISSITGATSITYFPFGMASGWTEPNSTTYARSFDQDGRITGVTLNSTTTNFQTITYDNASRITELQETGLNNKFYGYDADDRLTSFFNGTTTTSYTYDTNGNRTSMTLSGTTTLGYTTTSNMLQSLTGTTTASYTYDASGNQLTDGTATYTYDARGRMATATAGTTTASYGISGFGQRLSKAGTNVPSGGTNEFVYDELGNLLGEYGSTGTIIEETGYLPNTPLPVLSKGWGIAGLGTAVPYGVFTGTNGATVSSTTPDWLGAPHIIANSSKTYQWRWDHYDFGNNSPNQNPSGLGVFSYNFRFPGQYYDAESGLFYNGARDYSSLVGRYGEFDPIGLSAGINGYAFVGSNPLTHTDPNGNAAIAAPALPEVVPVCFESGPAVLTCVAVVGGALAIWEVYQYCMNSQMTPTAVDCEQADDACYEECQSYLGQGGRTNQGNSYRNCWVSCMKAKGCYSGDSPVQSFP
jgi:RHS repeat-associated protein